MRKIVLSLLTIFLGASAFAQGLSVTPNQPIGEGKGIFPGRVVWVMDTEVSKWDGASGRWWDEGNIDLALLENMYEKSILALAGSDNVRKAWDKIFRYHNKTNGRGNRGYRPGETIAVKINLNNTFSTDDYDNDIDQSPQATIALLRQLTENAGVPQKHIIVYDATIGWKPRAIPDRIYKPVHQLFPEVRWMSAEGSEGVEAADWIDNAISYTDSTVSLGTVLPRAVV